ncbi:MAG: hypothetical protein A3J07_01070 [Candidatus Doudnabacteria bacterium RIFCSPLOWO2_02_FULL_49_13]|uniref:O-antigen ligase-related domain-containing protein n=1 Tax=Candidatus Doudnabacteria bacterium RIFCSPHIGHO2_12_FULL_48_16 TaxID=1817838 RepID=A0A1F5PK62_9BACT|nr:MAG: hypothetical protein A3B77_04000 [Candidatus Doudnabacteria bacterium RIFCSPHIGHO2_02_FULL_49_24]OGE88650.1 MAG: hypothetical protein A2760_01660 [Candidatus Doudnabacteria bacterium RIFCSPHIGHO2_01_FULL_50_67]OGE90335.1 MAG: hypothetical protein A3E29_04580 [Candidatus Doudnabacteria bacterium RIFCSPHIGHO2_12_FULL_48_16]OGE97042.1 MAG: hypothetical protein A2990_01570 [Candidatus Doudnabacteria bacterium RIFCSPLOWO2_01_FULL_49_40]OGF02391.1 MAG: hypothetical protein A3J07_01070 [Candid
MFHPPALPFINNISQKFMFHVKQFLNFLENAAWRAGVKHLSAWLMKLRFHEVFFYLFLLLLPIQTRMLYNPAQSYISWYFNYHLAIFVYLTDLILILCFLSWLVFERPRISLTSKLWLLLGLFLWVVVSVFHVKQIKLGIYGVFKWFELLLLLIYLRETFRETIQFRLSATILFILGVTQAILALWQFHVQHMLGLKFLGEYIPPLGTTGLATIDTLGGKVIRAYGTFPHPNVLASFLIFALFMGFFLVSSAFAEASAGRRETKLRLFLVSCGTILITLGIFVTFSRLAWLATAIGYLGFGIYWLWHKQWKKSLILAIIGIVSCLSAGVLTKADGTYFELLKTRVLDQNQTSITDRGFFNDLGLNLVAQHPWLGVGVGNYVPALRDLYALKAWQYQPAHNIFIFIAAESGVGALAIFVLIIIQIFRGARHGPVGPLKFSLIFLGLIFLILGQFDHYFVTIQQGRLMLFVVLGLLAALPNLQHEILNDKL